MKELAIGEVGEIDGVKVRCVKHIDCSSCHKCVFEKRYVDFCFALKCTPSARKRREWVYYEAVTE